MNATAAVAAGIRVDTMADTEELVDVWEFAPEADIVAVGYCKTTECGISMELCIDMGIWEELCKKS